MSSFSSFPTVPKATTLQQTGNTPYNSPQDGPLGGAFKSPSKIIQNPHLLSRAIENRTNTFLQQVASNALDGVSSSVGNHRPAFNPDGLGNTYTNADGSPSFTSVIFPNMGISSTNHVHPERETAPGQALQMQSELPMPILSGTADAIPNAPAISSQEGANNNARVQDTAIPRVYSAVQDLDLGDQSFVSELQYDLVQDKLFIAMGEILQKIHAVEASNANKKGKLFIYQTLRKECQNLREELVRNFPMSPDVEELGNLQNLLFFYEIQNTDKVEFHTWDEIDRFLQGAKEKFLRGIKVVDVQERCSSCFDALVEMIEEQTKSKTGSSSSSSANSISSSQSDMDDDDSSQTAKISKKEKIEKEIISCVGEENRQSVVLFLQAFALWQAILAKSIQKEYVTAIEKNAAFESFTRLCNSDPNAVVQFDKDLFSTAVIEFDEDQDLFEFFSQKIIRYLVPHREISVVCKYIDLLQQQFCRLFALSDADAFNQEIQRIAQDKEIQSGIRRAFCETKEIIPLQKSISDIIKNVEALKPNSHFVFTPNLMEQPLREQIASSIVILSQEADRIHDSDLFNYCDDGMQYNFECAYGTIKFYKMQLGINAEPMTLADFFAISYQYLDAITDGEWSEPSTLQKRDQMKMISQEIAKIKASEDYQHPDDATEFNRLIQTIHLLQAEQWRIVQTVQIGDFPVMQMWAQRFLEWECVYAEREELFKTHTNDIEINQRIINLLYALSPLRFAISK